MPDIAKINAVAIADIEKVDGVLAANIEKVNGLTLPSTAPFVGLLDTYTGAAAGYSVRRLATAATVLMRVRRDTGGGTGDDDEADVAYDSNNILSLDSAISNASAGVTATTLGQFINVGTVGGTTYTNPDSLTATASCFVDSWYDQAGSNDAEQATHGDQPQIHDGTADTDLILENGKPAVKFDDDRLDASSVTYRDVAIVGNWTTTNGYRTIVGFDNLPNDNVLSCSTYDTQMYFAADQGFQDNVEYTSADTDFASCANQRLYYLTDASDHTSGAIVVGNRIVTSPEFLGNIQEVVIWGANKSRTGVQDNINDEFGIY